MLGKVIFLFYFLPVFSCQGNQVVELAEKGGHPNSYLLPKTCGIRNQVTNRIIGGKNANLGQFPWMARLFFRFKGNNYYIPTCAGSLINEKYVISAAHCFRFCCLAAVRLGENVVSSNIDCQNNVCAPEPQDIPPERVTIHEYFAFNKPLNYDIALIRLRRNAVFNRFVQPICLPYKSAKYDGKLYEHAGWGMTDAKSNVYPDVLQTLILKYVGLQECSNYYSYVNIHTQGIICAINELHMGSWLGDSGGPLMDVTTKDGIPVYYLAGIVSHRPNCTECKTPVIYMDVEYYYKWILDLIKQ